MGREKGKERDGEGVRSRGWALFPERTTNIWLSYFNFVPPSTSDHRESFSLRMAHVQWHLGRLSEILHAVDWRRVGGRGEGSQEERWHPSTQGCLPLGEEAEGEGIGGSRALPLTKGQTGLYPERGSRWSQTAGACQAPRRHPLPRAGAHSSKSCQSGQSLHAAVSPRPSRDLLRLSFRTNVCSY